MADFIGLMTSVMQGVNDWLFGLLGYLSLTVLQIAPWAISGVVAVAILLTSLGPFGELLSTVWHRKLLTLMQLLSASRTGLRVFALANAAIFGYILFTATDQRWSGKPSLTAAEVDKMSEGGAFSVVTIPYNATVDTLNGFMSQVTSSMNDTIAVKGALSVARPFLEYAIQAALWMIPLWLLIKLLSKPVAKQQARIDALLLEEEEEHQLAQDEIVFQQRVADAVYARLVQLGVIEPDETETMEEPDDGQAVRKGFVQTKDCISFTQSV